ncbi:AMED_5909 family protein [Lentzea sp. NPDC051213]|uniref:AMED_5909 family protein n=1 Tax=Lentzea sp. NPDC051213 TaxID=3364126 RepID=UPI003787F6EA
MNWNKAADNAQTLMQAHEALSRLMPRPDASPKAHAEYHRRSAAVYARVAEIDRGHFHETMFWATREREKAEAIEQSALA